MLKGLRDVFLDRSESRSYSRYRVRWHLNGARNPSWAVIFNQQEVLMKKLLVALVVAIAATFVGIANAQKPVLDANARDPRLFALEDLRPGMKGVARTVFSGG